MRSRKKLNQFLHFYFWLLHVCELTRDVCEITVGETTDIPLVSALAYGPLFLTEDDIPGSSLDGRDLSQSKNSELKFWLQCRGDNCKGLSTESANLSILENAKNVAIPVNGWSTSLAKSPMFTQAEIYKNVNNSEKKYRNIGYYSLPSGLNKAKAFLADEYLHEIQTHCMWSKIFLFPRKVLS